MLPEGHVQEGCLCQGNVSDTKKERQKIEIALCDVRPADDRLCVKPEQL